MRASSVDVRTVGAGGGSIAHVPELTKALRVGPQSAGADPGPAAYGKGGSEPTVTDANVVLGYLPAVAGGRRDHARRRRRRGRPWRRSPTAMGLESAGGRGGGHRRHRQREHARRPAAGLGAAGLRPARLRAGRLRRRRPAARQRAGRADRRVAGDRAAVAGRAVRARRRDHAACATSRPAPCCAASPTSTGAELGRSSRELADEAAVSGWPSRGCRVEQQTVGYQVDVRYHGQGFEIPIEVDGLADDPDWRCRLGDALRRRARAAVLASCSPSTTSWSTPGPRSPGRGPTVAPVTAGGGRRSTRRRSEPRIRSTSRAAWWTPAIYDRGDAARRRRGHRSGDRHRDGLHHPRPARPRGHRARVRAPC